MRKQRIAGPATACLRRLVAFSLLLIGASAACSKDSTGPSVTVTVNGASRLISGDSATLTASGVSGGGVGTELRSVTWKSSAPAIASVTTTGIVRGLAAGIAEITAAANGAVGTHAVAVDSGFVRLAGPSRVYLGDTATFSAVVVDSAGRPLVGRAVNWQSSAPDVASISSSGSISTAGLGSTTITAVAAGGSAKRVLTVGAPASVTITGATYLNPNDTSKLIAVARDSLGSVFTGRPVAWQSSAPNIATVSASGTVVALNVGDAEISATIAGRRASVVVAVLTLLSDQTWDRLNGWSIPGNGTILTSLPDSPFADKRGLQYRFPVGMKGGGADTLNPSSANWNFSGTSRPTELLISASVKVSSNYAPPPSNGQKLWYVATTSGAGGLSGVMWLEFFGVPGAVRADERPHVAIINQSVVDPVAYAPNITFTELAPGRWYRYDMYFKLPASPTSNDGVIKVWVDGVLNISRSNVAVFYGTRGFDTLHQNMQWGGGGIIAQEQFIWAAHNRLSGR